MTECIVTACPTNGRVETMAEAFAGGARVLGRHVAGIAAEL